MLKNPTIANSIGKIADSAAGVGVLNTFIGNFISLGFGLAGIILFFMLLWGAFEFTTSGGDKEGTEKAKKKMTTALIGICLVFSIYAILAVVETLFGINLTLINIPTID